MGSSSHLPPYSSQPDPYPQSSLAQQARCLIPTKRLPAGGCSGGVGGETKAGRRCGSWGPPHRGPLTWSLARRGTRPRQTASCLLPAASSSSSLFYQPHRPQGLTERQKRGRRKRPRRGGWWANEHNEETDTDYPDPPPPSSIHLWVRISLFPMGRLLPSPPLPCVTPLFPPSSLSSYSQASPHALCGQSRPYWPFKHYCFLKRVSNMRFIV